MNTKFKAVILSCLFVGLSVQTAMADGKYRHVLACVEDGGLVENELVIDLANSEVEIFRSSTSRALKVDTFDEWTTLGVNMGAGPENVFVAVVMGKIRLSDGKYYDVGPFGFLDGSLHRIFFSYGLGAMAPFAPGWAYSYAIPDVANPGQMKISFQDDFDPPSVPHRYLGSFYLKLNPACIGQPTTGNGECSYTPNISSSCLSGNVMDCPPNYGRLIGVMMNRANNRYIYSMPAEIGCVGANCNRILNLNPMAKKHYITNKGATSITVDLGSYQATLSNKGTNLFPEIEEGISVTTPGADVWLSGHEEEIRFYE